MAKIVGNAFVGFNGKLGNLVGYNWKGVWCVRSRPAAVHNPRTEAQQLHRTMFAEQVRLAGRMKWAVNIGFAAVADEIHITSQNAFVKANQSAFSAGDGGLAVDWNALAVSAGPVAPVALGVPQLDDDGVLTVAFDKNPLHLSSNNFDSVHLYVYCPALKADYLAAPVYRKDRRVSVSLPDDMAAHELHLYAFVTDSQGRASSTSHAAIPLSPDLSEEETLAVEGMTPHPIPTATVTPSTSPNNTDTSPTPNLIASSKSSSAPAPPHRSGGDEMSLKMIPKNVSKNIPKNVPKNDTKKDTKDTLPNDIQLTERQIKIIERLIAIGEKSALEDDTKNVTQNVTQKVTKDVTKDVLDNVLDNVLENVLENAESLSKCLKVNIKTIKRDIVTLQRLGYLRHVGPSNGGYWQVLKKVER